MNMQISPASTQSHQPAPPDPLNCSKRQTMADTKAVPKAVSNRFSGSAFGKLQF